MKNLNKRLSFLLVLLLVVSLLAACSDNNEEPNAGNAGGNQQSDNADNGETPLLAEEGFPIVNEPITLKFFSRKNPPNGAAEEMLTFKKYEEMTGIDVEWEDVPIEGFAERKNLVFASNELPDVFYKSRITPLEAVKYGSSGMLIPLEGLIDEYAPNIKKFLVDYPEIKASITAPDGHIYAIPGIVTLEAGRTSKFWMNQAWLDQINMDVPTSPDELIKVLTAFRDQDLDGNNEQDEIPFSQRNWNELMYVMSGSWGLSQQMGYSINVDNDEIDIWVDDERYKEYLMFLRKLYEEKLMDRAVFTQKPSEFVAKMSAGSLGMFFNQASDPFAKHKDNYIGIAPLVGPYGDQEHHAKPVARDFGTFAISSVNEHPEASMRWIDYFYSEEGATFIRYGIEGETFNYKEDGTPEYTDEILNDERGTGVTIGQFAPWPGGGAPHWINNENSSAINPPEVQAAQEQLNPYLPKQIYGAPIFDENTAKEVDTLRQDIDTFVEESSAKFITGSLSFDKWDEYVSTLEKIDLERLQQIYQEAYDLNYK